VKSRYVADGFRYPSSVQAAHGHQVTDVAAVCARCHGRRPTYRWAGDRAHRWAGTLTSSHRARGAAVGHCASR
jgi:hypothetical protein